MSPPGRLTMILDFGRSVTSSWTSRLPGSTSRMGYLASRQSRRSDRRFAVSTRLAPPPRRRYARGITIEHASEVAIR